MSLTTLYLFLVVLPNLHDLAYGPIMIFPLISIAAGGLALFGGYVDDEEWLQRLGSKMLKISIGVLVTLCLFGALTPSDKQIYTVAGGYTVTNTKDVQKLPDNVVKAANAWLEKTAEAAQPEKKEKK